MKSEKVKSYLKTRAERSTTIKRQFIVTHFAVFTKIVNLMIETYKKRGKFIFMGNGGSAADAQHAAAEFLGKFKKDRPAIPAIAITTDTSTLTAIGNDYGYEMVFKRQLDALLDPEKDLVFCISTSGNSPNVITAIETLDNIYPQVISLTGGTGGKLKSLSNWNLNVELAEGSAECQEMHVFILHSLIDLFEQELEFS